MEQSEAHLADHLMLAGVSAVCADCGDERIFLPVDQEVPDEYCCTSCDAAVVLLGVATERARPGAVDRVA